MDKLFLVLTRMFEYYRGFLFFVKVKLCNGKIISIPRLQKNVYFKYPPHKNIIIGKNCFFGMNTIIDVPKCGKLIIGDNVIFASNIVVSSNSKIKIGNNCLIAEFVSIRDAEHSVIKNDLIINQKLLDSEVVLENDVWIGRSTAVLMGSYISEGCIIGANSLIRKIRTEPHTIYIGNPIKKLKSRI